MVVLKRRSMMVTFRVSSEEHEALTKSCEECGSRSIAEFARSAVLQRMQSLRAPSGNLTGDLMTLSKGLRELDVSLANVRKRIRGILGPVNSRVAVVNESAQAMSERNDA
jgi:hypothetical protein